MMNMFVGECRYRYGATSMALAYYARHGCTSRADTPVQKLGDTGVPTNDLQRLSAAVLKLRADIRQLPVDGSVPTEHARTALANVSLVRIPADISRTSGGNANAGGGERPDGAADGSVDRAT